MRHDPGRLASLSAVIARENLRGFLNDLRGFRHLFRHSYDFQLDSERLSRLVRDWNTARLEIIAALDHFRNYLLKTAQI